MTHSEILDRNEVIDIVGIEVVKRAEVIKPVLKSNCIAAENFDYDYYSAELRIGETIVIVYYRTDEPQEKIMLDENWSDAPNFIRDSYQIAYL